jgi:hypothetical protein
MLGRVSGEPNDLDMPSTTSVRRAVSGKPCMSAMLMLSIGCAHAMPDYA